MINNATAQDWEDFWESEDISKSHKYDERIRDSFRKLYHDGAENQALYWLGLLYKPNGDRSHLWDNDTYMEIVLEEMDKRYVSCCGG